ncbi:hypothetical protein BDZ45DRAFT_739873 [Acephala macrosclerotiorum]|nr:hypothetical protein BDZ45DRAFT_739873 [Acephala macrosclerotiorum]
MSPGRKSYEVWNTSVKELAIHKDIVLFQCRGSTGYCYGSILERHVVALSNLVFCLQELESFPSTLSEPSSNKLAVYPGIKRLLSYKSQRQPCLLGMNLLHSIYHSVDVEVKDEDEGHPQIREAKFCQIIRGSSCPLNTSYLSMKSDDPITDHDVRGPIIPRFMATGSSALHHDSCRGL